MNTRLPLIVAAIAVLTSLCMTMFTASAAVAANPNILIILVDDMGYGDPGCFNANSKIPTPNIDSLARGGMRFTDAHAAGPLCHVSRYGLLTGRHPFRANVAWARRPVIQHDQLTIASMLKSAGYRTAMVGKWHLGFEENGYDKPMPGGPVDCGFDSFFGIRASTDIPPYFYIRDDMAVTPPTDQIDANHSDGWTSIQGAFWREGGIAPELELKDVLPRFTEEAIAVIDEHSADNDENGTDAPLMLYLAFPAPHTPWLPSQEFAGQSGAGMYGDFAMMVDDMIGRVLGKLDEEGMADSTLVVFTSDNGPVWYEADVERFGHDASGGLRGMKADAWEGGHRMPFIVRWPGRIEASSTSNQLICFTDVLATLAAVADAELPPDAGSDSFDFSQVLFGENNDEQPIREHLVIKSGNGMMTIRSGDWKLIEGLGSGGFTRPGRIEPGGGDPAGQLYDLSTDPAEVKNLYQAMPDKVEELQNQMRRVVESERTRSSIEVP